MLLVDFILCQHGIGRSRCGSVTLRLGHAPALTVPRTVRAGAPLRYALDSGSTGRKAVQVQVLLPAPWRVFLQHLKSCEDTRFFSAQTAGLSSVV